jgi:DNA (cytosine-5)-methyltransferase 1
MKKINVASLFSGCGGMDIGFEGDFSIPHESLPNLKLKKNNFKYITVPKLKFETVFACDVNNKAQRAWENYFSKKRNISGIYHHKSIVDIVKEIKIGQLSIPRDINVVTGGFPCNDFSVAGKRLGFNSNKSHKGNGTLLNDVEDDISVENRGMLYYWMREFIGLTAPHVFYAENVKGLVSLGDAKDIIASDFSKINNENYFVLPVKVLRAIDYGVPQTRERVIFIGINLNKVRPSVKAYIKKNQNLPEELDLYPKETHGPNKGTLSYVGCEAAFRGLKEPEDSIDPSQRAYSKAKFMGKMQGQSEIILNKPGPTIRAEHHGNIEFRRLGLDLGGKNLDELNKGLQQRRLTVRECARIQTFPDDFEFVKDNLLSSTDGYRLIGNAVPPLLAFHLANRLQDVWSGIFKD